MAIDSAEKRRRALNVWKGWADTVLPSPDSDISDLDKIQLLQGYFVFSGVPSYRHELAIRRMWPVKELIIDE